MQIPRVFFGIGHNTVLIECLNRMYKLSPSDFAYLYEECKHCYYQKVKGFVKELPSISMPGVFSKMNSFLQNAIMGMDLMGINSKLPAGKIEVKEGFLKSKPIPPSSILRLLIPAKVRYRSFSPNFLLINLP